MLETLHAKLAAARLLGQRPMKTIGAIGAKSWPKAILPKVKSAPHTQRIHRRVQQDASAGTKSGGPGTAVQAPSLGRRRRVGQVFQQKHAQVTSHAVAVSWTPGA
jgi:hypothetical protein